MEEKPLFMKSIAEMTDEDLDFWIEKAKKGTTTFKFARKEEDRFKPKIYGQAPMIISDELVGGRYSPADGQTYDSKAEWHKSFDRNGIMMVDKGTKLPPKKIDQITDQEYIDTVKEAERMVDWNEAYIPESEKEDNKQIREALVNKHGTEEQRKPSNKRKIVEGK
jgi:hypothetical protein